MENDPALMQEPLVGFHEGAVQAEGRDPIAEDAAQMVVGIVQMDLGPLPEEPDGCGDTGGAGADDREATTAQALGVGFQTDSVQIAERDFLLDLIPADRNLFHVEDAGAVAELFPVADPGGHG